MKFRYVCLAAGTAAATLLMGACPAPGTAGLPISNVPSFLLASAAAGSGARTSLLGSTVSNPSTTNTNPASVGVAQTPTDAGFGGVGTGGFSSAPAGAFTSGSGLGTTPGFGFNGLQGIGLGGALPGAGGSGSNPPTDAFGVILGG